jgi:hypothetical protein
MSKSGLLIIIASIGCIFITYHFRDSIERLFHPPMQIQNIVPKKEVLQVPVAKYPVSQKKYAKNLADSPLPTIQNSDHSFAEELVALLGKKRFEAIFDPEDMIRHIVLTIEDATNKKQQLQYLPVKSPEGKFLVKRLGPDLIIDPKNYKRYSPYVDLLQHVDVNKLVALYRHFYPLFQSAYVDLSAQGFFNDRLIAVIDTIVATPESKEPIKLVQPIFYYKFADDSLESLSSVQKFVLRMGPTNAEIVKTKLREIRLLLTSLN